MKDEIKVKSDVQYGPYDMEETKTIVAGLNAKIEKLEAQLEKSEIFNSENLERFDLLLRIKKLVRRGYAVLGEPIHQELERLTENK